MAIANFTSWTESDTNNRLVRNTVKITAASFAKQDYSRIYSGDLSLNSEAHFRFETQITGGTAANQGMYLCMTNSDGGTLNGYDAAGFYGMGAIVDYNSGSPLIHAKTVNNGANTWSTGVSISLSTTYWVDVLVDDTNVTVKVYSDSNFSTQVGSTQTVAVVAGDYDYFIFNGSGTSNADEVNGWVQFLSINPPTDSQDLATWTESDAAGVLSVNSYIINAVIWEKQDYSRVYKQINLNRIHYRFQTIVETGTEVNQRMFLHLTDSAGTSANGHGTAGYDGMGSAVDYQSGSPKIYALKYSSGSSTFSAGVSISIDTNYWVDVVIDDTNVTVKVYSDSGFSSQVGADQSVTIVSGSLVYLCVNGDGSANTDSIDGFVGEIELVSTNVSEDKLLNASVNIPASEVLCNARIEGENSNTNNLNARILIEQEGKCWVNIEGQDFSDRWMKVRTVRKLSQLSQFECELTGIEDADKAYVKKGATVYFYFDNQNNLMQKGVIETVEYQTEFDCKITGYGMAKKLQERKVNPKDVEGKSIFTRVNSDTIISTLCSFNDDATSPYILSVGQNDSIPGLTIRFDDEDKLRAVAATVEQAGLDWWMTHIGEAQDIINVGLRDTTSKMTFYTAGANQNAYSVSYEEDIEDLANFVVAIGKGDGVNQYSTTFYDASPTWTKISGTEISAYSSDSNTVALYHFENNATDSGPSGHDLSTSGTPTYISSGAVIGTYAADSQPSLTYYHYAGSPNTTWFTNMPSGTFEFWIYPTGTQFGDVAVITSGAHTMFHLGDGGGFRPYFVFQKGGVQDATNSFNVNQWNHFALTWNLGSMEAKLYLNGNLDSVHNGSFYLEDETPSTLRLGNWKGYFDEMRLSNSVRSSFNTDATNISEIQNSIPVSGTSGFSSPGTINIGNEQIIYSGTDATHFTSCTRGANSTTAVTHPIGALTFKYISSGTFWSNHLLSESGSSIYANGLKFKKIDAKDTEDINAVQTRASNYLDDNRTLGKRIVIEVGDMREVHDNCDVGEWVTVVDADTGLNADYKIVGMETIISYEDGETMYLELVKTKKVLLENLMQSVKDVSILNAYSQGSTTTPAIGPQEGNTKGGTTGFDYPLSMKFYIPSDAKKINKVKLSWNQADFQGTTSGTSSGIYTQSGAYQKVSVKIDGTDRTSALSGPWSGNSVTDLDVSSYITLGGYHTIDLCTSGTDARRISANGWAQVYVPSR
uniref:Putative tail protein n=1 Tax=viral metagenome TaxID=1070528 RepID=A0A6H1ZNY0_9ZZZZ